MVGLAAMVTGALPLLAAPTAKTEPVAAGFPAWSGVVAKNHVCGRELWPSDLRHRITVVVDVEPGEKLQGQLALAGQFAAMSGWATAGESANWDSFEPPRHPLTVVSVHGTRDYETVLVAWDDALLTTAADETEAIRLEARKNAVEKRKARIDDAASAF